MSALEEKGRQLNYAAAVHFHTSADFTRVSRIGPRWNSCIKRTRLKMWAYHVIFLPLSQFPWEEIPRLGDCSSYQCRKKKGELRKGSETKWITARQWPSPGTWPPFPGSLSALVQGWHRQVNGWIEGWMDWHKYMLSCPFSNGRSTIRKERLSVMNYCGIFSKKTLQRLSRVRRCSV